MVKEKLVEIMQKTCDSYETCFGRSCDECLADGLIANGAVIRQKGEWVWKLFPKDDGTVERKAVCSLCGEPNKQYTPPYCPHCGADMGAENAPKAQHELLGGLLGELLELANGVTARQHGEWKAVECGTMCTNCKRVFDHHFEISRHVCVKLRKCPDCGADMRGGT